MKLEDNVTIGVHKRSAFDLGYDGVLSQSWGDIVPIVCKEMVPGDSFTCDAQAFVRMAPLATPTYGRIHGYINYFFVPNRILLEDDLWQDFIRGGVQGTTSYNLPEFSPRLLAAVFNDASDAEDGHIHLDDTDPDDADMLRRIRKQFTYLGLPDPKTYGASQLHLSLLPFAAYNRIYGDYYFPWGLENDVAAEQLYFKKLGSNFYNPSTSWWENFTTLGREFFTTKRACYRKDYFTTAQINPQRGGQSYVYDNGGTAQDLPLPDNTGGEYVEDAENYRTTITSVAVRWAMQFQKFLERNNIAGARYFEQILARFGVKIQAERLQRSEYLGGKDFWINVSDVTSTSKTEGANLGDMAGKGIGLGNAGISYNAQDYGFFIALLHLMPESGIVQGIPRMFMRGDRFDYFTPELEETGMQPIYLPEVWGDIYTGIARSGRMEDQSVYGYIPRYAEYKYSAPLLAGDFRLHFEEESGSDFLSLTDMDSMHLYRLFRAPTELDEGDIPVLNSSNVVLSYPAENTFNRIFQDTNSDFDHFWVNIQVKLGAIRPMLGYVEASTDFTGDDKNAKVSLPSFGMRL